MQPQAVGPVSFGQEEHPPQEIQHPSLQRHYGRADPPTAAGHAPVITAADGNAQSFRVVTKLASRDVDYPGLNLTRATLDAVQKYPWHRGAEPRKRRKWGAYCTEAEIFTWTRRLHHGEERTQQQVRIIVDVIAELTEHRAYEVHKTLTGYSPASVLDHAGR